MADTAPAFDLNKGIYFPQLKEKFVISEDELYDYYSTNSGMYPKNPGSGGGGGGGGDLDGRVADLEDAMDGVREEQATQNTAISNNGAAITSMNNRLSTAAISAENPLSGFVNSEDLSDVQQIIDNQAVLRDSQENFYQAISSTTV